ncbi:MAG: DUF3419 family protein [Deltaproteobacteria bacterium]|nr:DUF3419 family protein [Deltaproteobacteria bacterium]
MSEYFQSLNYTLSNEDTRIEWKLLKDDLESVFCIGGSGARVLPLLAKNPRNLDVIDLSLEQLALVELRVAAAKHLSRDEFLFLLGYRGGIPGNSISGDDRLEVFISLKPFLSEKTFRFWLDRKNAWTPRGFVLLGRWEGHFQKMGRVFREVLRIDTRPIFEAHSLQEQAKLFKRHFKPLVFKAFVRIAASEFVFNRFLYKGHFSGQADRRTESRAPSVFIEEEFTRLFTRTLIRKNYFLQILFLGGIYYEEGLPLEAREDILESIEKAETKVNYRQDNLLNAIKLTPYDFVSLSDTISYIPEAEAIALLNNLPSQTRSGSRVVIRSFLRRPPEIASGGWEKLRAEEEWARDLDTTGVYEFDIFEKK